MKLYLIQHGLAVPDEVDPQKPLSREGIEATQEVARFLSDRAVKVDCIWHSPKVRSVQTAEIISRSVSCPDLAERDDLNPNDPVDEFPGEFQKLNTDLMIAGHLPFLRKLVSLLLTGSDGLDLVSFKNSGVVCLEYQGAWKLAWAVTPDLL
ncbi:MAG: phosphohistidine phosphatase SixA [Candidatus Omnitrophica bacterium]|nr:phosphohistidine phosphatase SixA [Candidatus Omnitrophota bacterium]